MEIFLIIVQAVVALAMIGFILLQKSEGGGLVSQQGGQAMGRFMSRRGQADFLTRGTSILAGGFMVLCLIIAIISGQKAKNNPLLDQVVAEEKVASEKAEAPSVEAPQAQVEEAPKAEAKGAADTGVAAPNLAAS